MARLTRVNQKVFASGASNNGVFGSAQAGNATTSNDVATLQSLPAFLTGWDSAAYSGEKLPPLEEFQGIQYGISYQQAYMLQEGIAEWNADTTYYKGSLCKTISGTSFKLYCSLLDNNLNKATTNTTYWKKVMDSDDIYAYSSQIPASVGSTTQPVYTNSNGVITACDSLSTVLGTIYPVGAIYIGTQATCPLATLITGSTWTKIEGRYLLASGTLTGTEETYSATDTASAGLPNITGDTGAWGVHGEGDKGTGAFYQKSTGWGIGDTDPNSSFYAMDASRSSAIYGGSTTVRPASYVVNVWRRTA